MPCHARLALDYRRETHAGTAWALLAARARQLDAQLQPAHALGGLLGFRTAAL